MPDDKTATASTPPAIAYETPSPAMAKLANRRRVAQIIGWVFIASIFTAIAMILFYVVIPFVAQQRRITARERQLLYQTDPQKLLAACREVYDKKISTGNPNNPRVPPLIRSLNPHYIAVMDDSVNLEFGGGFFHYGVTAFRPGVRGYGTKEIIPGLWFDAEDGKVPAR